jgi:hypothetical protein
MQQSLTWYLPTMFGDVRLESRGKDKTMVLSADLSPTEKVAIETLARTGSNSWFRKWLHRRDFEKAMAAYSAGRGLTLEIDAPIEQVQAVLARVLKPGRRLLSVAMTDKGIEEIWRSDAEVIPSKDATPYRGSDPPKKTEEPAVEAAEEPKAELAPPIDDKPAPAPEKAKGATTVAQPVRGCPAPDFANSPDARANRVLEAFLLPEQREDWRRHGAFVTRGMDSGHRYMLTSRDARTPLAQYARSVFDLDERQAYCVHDWDVPAAEELLALHAFLSVPGGERYMRLIPGELPIIRVPGLA